MKIDRFKEGYFFLSNFYLCEIVWEGVTYASTEHAYQAAKNSDPKYREAMQKCKSAGAAKRMGGNCKCRPDWDSVKRSIMLELVRQKFNRYQDLRDLLLQTGDKELEEGNSHGDQIWGTVNGVGQNWLGLILMQVREEIRNPLPMEPV